MARRRARVRGVERHRRAAPGLRAVGVADGDEVVTSPFSFVASANSVLFERARPVFADIDRATLNLDPEAAAAAVTDRTTALLPVHIFGYPADLPAFERMGLPIVEDACEALGAVHGDGMRVGARGHPAAFGFYANKQLTTGEGGMVTVADAALKERIDSERNQGRAPDMGWLDHDRLGFNYRLTDVACAHRLGPARRAWTACWPTARGSPARYREALAGIEGLGLPCEDAGGERRGWFVFVVQVPRGRDRDEVIHALRAARRAVQALPAGHPPHELLPRALRPSRGRVPRLRGRRRTLGGAAVLPRHDRGPGRAGGRRRWRRRSARVHNPAHGEPASRRGARTPPPGPAGRRRGLRGAVALPIVLWHRVVADIASEFHLDAQYLITGWSPWVLMALGLLCFVPVVVDDWRDPDRRFHHSGTGAWLGWAITLYLLGFALATQVAQIADGLSAA